MTTTAPNLAGMREYTAWYLKHPWHVSGTPESGNVPPTCDCGCQLRGDLFTTGHAFRDGVCKWCEKTGCQAFGADDGSKECAG